MRCLSIINLSIFLICFSVFSLKAKCPLRGWMPGMSCVSPDKDKQGERLAEFALLVARSRHEHLAERERSAQRIDRYADLVLLGTAGVFLALQAIGYALDDNVPEGPLKNLLQPRNCVKASLLTGGAVVVAGVMAAREACKRKFIPSKFLPAQYRRPTQAELTQAVRDYYSKLEALANARAGKGI